MTEEVNELRTDRWKEKTDFIPGFVPGETDIPELRYQVLSGNVYTLQVWRDGSTARGQMTLDELEGQLGKRVTKQGWYDHAGTYLGDDPQLS